MWLAGMSCAATLLGAIRISLRDRLGWAILSGGILLLMWFMWKSGNQSAGIVGGILWAIFLMIPSIAMRIMSRAMVRGDYAGATRMAWVVAVLHPTDGLWSNARICRALRMVDSGDMARGMLILEKISCGRTAAAQTAFVHRLRIERRWDELTAWWRSAGWKEVRRFPTLLPTILRSLGECGDLNGMVETFERHKRMLEAPHFAGVRALARLAVMALCGRVDAVRAILMRELRDLREDWKQYWLGVAEMAEGRRAQAQARLVGFELMASPFVAGEIAWRMRHPPAPAELLDPLLGEILEEDHAHRDQEIRYASSTGKALMTRLLVALNIIYFIIEQFAGGTMNDAALLRVGVLDPQLVRQGQWWRLLTANFMHYGPIHLGMNMVALLALGPFVESAMGGPAYLLAYLACGIGAMGAVLEAQKLGYLKAEVLLGASGAIMGLVGMTAGILARGWLRERARAAARRLQLIALIVLMQMVFDWMTPEVSSTAHMAGLILGFIIALAWPGKAIGWPHGGSSRPPGISRWASGIGGSRRDAATDNRARSG
jgi:rhomboid protease GluP